MIYQQVVEIGICQVIFHSNGVGHTLAATKEWFNNGTGMSEGFSSSGGITGADVVGVGCWCSK